MDEACETCKFWEEDRGKFGFGVCRKNAPTPVTRILKRDVSDDDFLAMWPVTDCGDWCGEYKENPEVIAKIAFELSKNKGEKNVNRV